MPRVRPRQITRRDKNEGRRVYARLQGQKRRQQKLIFETRNDAVKLQYELLGILDSKASALLSFDALALATLTIWLAYIPLNFMHFILDLVFLSMLLSCILLLRIIWLRWAKGSDDEESLNALRVRRTRYYQGAWRLALGGILAIVAVSAVHTVGTWLEATGTCGDRCSYFYSEEIFGNIDYGG